MAVSYQPSAVGIRRSLLQNGFGDQWGTTLAVTGRVSVRWLGKATVSSAEKSPLSFRGPSWTVMREVSVPGLDVISHVSDSCPDGRRRMSDVLSGAFTVSLMVF